MNYECECTHFTNDCECTLISIMHNYLKQNNKNMFLI